MLAACSNAQTAPELLLRLAAARVLSDELFSLVRPDSLYERPIPERHRIIFYLGHLEAFDWNLLRERILGLKAFQPEFDRLFSFGIDPVGSGLPSDQPIDWPALDDVRQYVRRMRQTLDVKVARAVGSASLLTIPHAEFSLPQLLHVATEHRLMHAETLAYMLHQLPLERKVRKPRQPELVTPPVPPRMIEIPPGPATLGISRTEGVFGWDNEFEEHTVDVPGFAIDQFMVTNAQYLEFVDTGGYEDRSLWKEDDWAWKTAHNISYPIFWARPADRWRYRTMFDEIPLPLAWPVYVSHAEASAYARWAGKSLPTEMQWHRAAYGTPEGTERAYPWGSQAPSTSLGNFDFHSWNPAAVSSSPRGQSAFGVVGMLGNGWEWTASLFTPFPGFQRFSFYPGYSADFFDQKHYVMKGGSARTAARMLRRSFRNWFQPHYQYVYAGFRCVSN